MRRPSTTALYSRPAARPKLTASSTAIQQPLTSPVDENTSPSRSPVVPHSSNLKEARTWEHERLRLKKNAAFVKSKARKAQGWLPKLHTDRPPRAVATPLGDDELIASEESKVDWDDLTYPLRSPRSPELDEITERTWKKDISFPSEVPLADLLISRKPRHRREPDFEVVPPVRSVIVLDDTAAPDLDVDEPWEHVYAEDADDHSRRNNGHGVQPSYAKIASLN